MPKIIRVSDETHKELKSLSNKNSRTIGNLVKIAVRLLKNEIEREQLKEWQE